MLRKEQAHVVILGGGFAGLAAARTLNVRGVRITLVDRCNHHLFQPLLYQVATAALAAPDISTPIRQLLRKQRNVTVFMDNVEHIDVRNRRIMLGGRPLEYDHLIVATGMTQTYFGNDHWAAFAPSLKTVGEALDIRRRILRAFESAEIENEPSARRIWTTFVVIGGGPTGVELAGALAEIAGRTLARDFRRFDPRTTRVILIEAGKRVLAGFPEELSYRAQEHLENLGIEVRLGLRVTDIGEDYVEIGKERIPTRTVLWAAGVRATPLTADLGVPLDNAGRVLVEDDLSIPGRPEVFVVGDLISKRQNDRPLPGVAQLAIQSGRHAAHNLRLALGGKPRRPFQFVDKGMMATIGRNRAVAQIGRFKSSGIVAWFLWLVVHLLSLVGFRSRISVLMEWSLAYFTWRRRSRVIVDTPSAPRAVATAQAPVAQPPVAEAPAGQPPAAPGLPALAPLSAAGAPVATPPAAAPVQRHSPAVLMQVVRAAQDAQTAPARPTLTRAPRPEVPRGEVSMPSSLAELRARIAAKPKPEHPAENTVVDPVKPTDHLGRRRGR
jgi:NADH dehydrogenase